MSDNAEGASAAPKKISKQEAVRRSLLKLGEDAMPLAVQAEVKKTFDLDVSRNYVSDIKAKALKAAAPAKKAAPAPEGPPARGEGADAGATVSLEDVLAVRGLVERVGADNLRKLIDAFSR